MSLRWNIGKKYSQQYSEDIIITEEHLPDQIIQFNASFIQGINMIDVYVNGKIQPLDKYVEESNSSIRFLDEDYLEVGDIVSVRYRTTNYNLGNVLVRPTYASLLEYANPVYNLVAIVTQSKKFYIYGRDGWEEMVIPFTSNNIGMIFKHEVQEVTDSLEYTLETISYQPDMGSILIFVDGEKIDPDNYIELDSNTIVFNEGVLDGKNEIEFLTVDTDKWEDCFSHSIEYEYDVNGNVIEEKVLYQNIAVRTTNYIYDSEGNIVQEIITKGHKTIVKEYEYDDYGNISSIDVIVN